jgi:hypothetical protein
VVEPHNHRVNVAKRAIQTCKDAFIAALATTDQEFPQQMWEILAVQVQKHTELTVGVQDQPQHLHIRGPQWPKQLGSLLLGVQCKICQIFKWPQYHF